ncbi:HTH-type transcriptional regulator LrpA [uncultured archaeon]|nr:HTH-type transcriptional regulator LrpA [uncultured archaeon]
MAELDRVSRRILQELSSDARIPINRLAKNLGKSRSVVFSRLRFMENEFGLRYTLELDMQKLGLSSYLIKAKLRKPVDRALLHEFIKNDPTAQFIAVTKGEFDLLICAVAKSQLQYIRWEYSMRSSLKDYLVWWKASPVVFERVGFFPLNDGLIRSLELPEIQKNLLASLNEDARTPFNELAKKLGVTLAALRYHFKVLLKAGLIKRFTAVMQKPPMPFHIVYFTTFTYAKGYEERCKEMRKLSTRESQEQPCNTYSLAYELSGGSDMFVWASFNDLKEGYARVEEEDKIFELDEIRHETALALEVIHGLWPIRNVEIKKLYDASSWEEIKEQ